MFNWVEHIFAFIGVVTVGIASYSWIRDLRQRRKYKKDGIL
jgi:fatty-acid desaturase